MDIEGGEKDVLANPQGWIESVHSMTMELHDRISMILHFMTILRNPTDR
jgi:hypothetical protein